MESIFYVIRIKQANEKKMQLTKRLELSFLDVFALPKASKIGFVFNISYSIPVPPPRAAKYCIAIFAVSVFPAPLSPLQQNKQVGQIYLDLNTSIKYLDFNTVIITNQLRVLNFT